LTTINPNFDYCYIFAKSAVPNFHVSNAILATCMLPYIQSVRRIPKGLWEHGWISGP